MPTSPNKNQILSESSPKEITNSEVDRDLVFEVVREALGKPAKKP